MGLNANKIVSSIPIIGGWFDDTEQKAMDALEKNQSLYGSILTPDLEKMLPEEYKWLQDYAPEKAEAQTVSEDPLTRSAQLSALSKMAGLSETGLSDVDQAAFEKARNMAGQIAHSGSAAALQNAQARGVGGSGLEFLMREQAGQNAAQQAQEAALAQASQAAQMRAGYLNQYMQGTSNMRDQDYRTAAGNMGILNQFNQANTQAANEAQQFNIGNRQNVANQNVQAKTQASQYNNNIANQTFQNQMTKANGQAGANTGVAQGYAAQNAANSAERNANTSIATSILFPTPKAKKE